MKIYQKVFWTFSASQWGPTVKFCCLHYQFVFICDAGNPWSFTISFNLNWYFQNYCCTDYAIDEIPDTKNTCISLLNSCFTNELTMYMFYKWTNKVYIKDLSTIPAWLTYKLCFLYVSLPTRMWFLQHKTMPAPQGNLDFPYCGCGTSGHPRSLLLTLDIELPLSQMHRLN